MVAKGWGGLDWEFGVSRCKLLYAKWINFKALLYSTVNYIQYPVINHNGENMKKNVYICIISNIYKIYIYMYIIMCVYIYIYIYNFGHLV